MIKHNGTKLLETDRFILRKFKLFDAQDIYNNWSSDKDSAKYNAWRVHPNLQITKEHLADWIEGYLKNDYYNWAIVDKTNEEVIGSISATNIKRRKKYCEIGYTIAKKMWNLGIATEVLIRVIEYLTHEEGFETIRALHHIENQASGKVMQKAGMQFIKNKTQIFLNSNSLLMKCSVYEIKRMRDTP